MVLELSGKHRLLNGIIKETRIGAGCKLSGRHERINGIVREAVGLSQDLN